jgi:hypothetical protein
LNKLHGAVARGDGGHVLEGPFVVTQNSFMRLFVVKLGRLQVADDHVLVCEVSFRHFKLVFGAIPNEIFPVCLLVFGELQVTKTDALDQPL